MRLQVWICAFMLVGALHGGVTVGAVEVGHSAQTYYYYVATPRSSLLTTSTACSLRGVLLPQPLTATYPPTNIPTHQPTYLPTYVPAYYVLLPLPGGALD